MNKNEKILVVAVVGMLLLFGYTQGAFDPWINPPPPTETQYSSFKVSVSDQGAGTLVSGGVAYTWYDANDDGRMQQSEVGTTTDASGVYTTTNEDYPIGADFDLWVQFVYAGYGTVHALVHMTGTRNSDGAAKSVGQIMTTDIDDTVTYSGTMKNIAWDDSSDYNSTTYGASGEAKVITTIAVSGDGIANEIWQGINYKAVYGIDAETEYWIPWSTIYSGGINEDNMMAPMFLSLIFSEADAGDLKPSVGDFDFIYEGATNYYYTAFVQDSWGDLVYLPTFSVSPTPEFVFDFGPVTAAGTTLATYGVSLWYNVPYQTMLYGGYSAAAYYAGTPGDDWDFTV